MSARDQLMAYVRTSRTPNPEEAAAWFKLGVMAACRHPEWEMAWSGLILDGPMAAPGLSASAADEVVGSLPVEVVS